MAEEFTRSEFQDRVLAIPEEFDVFLGGGRGGGKSFTLALLALRHMEMYRERARVLYLRQTYKGIQDFELITRDLFGKAYGPAARYNGTEHVWRVPGDGYMELGQLETHGDYSKYQGRSFSLLLVDEAGLYPSPDLLDVMRSNLRGGRDVPIRMIVAANPGGPGHHWIARRYVFVSRPWSPFREDRSKREWVHAPSTYLSNPHIDQAAYSDQLESACPSDPELLRAWKQGDWAVARGAYFAQVLEESRVAVGPFKEVPTTHGQRWETYLAHDFGSTAPSVTYLMAKSPGGEWAGKFYPRDSIIVLDELAAYQRQNLNKGLGWTAKTTAEAIRSELCEKWKVAPAGVADDGCFSNNGAAAGTIADEFAQAGVRFTKANKGDRIPGWQKMARMFADAGKPDVPGLYVSRDCEYFWATVPYLPRDPKRVEDVDSSGPDHGADAIRYGLRKVAWAMRIDLKIAN